MPRSAKNFMRRTNLLILLTVSFLCQQGIAQQDPKRILAAHSLLDSLHGRTAVTPTDTSSSPRAGGVIHPPAVKPKHDPHISTLRSAILPGWGQAYNHEYWKIPIVYAALGIPVGTFIYNKNWY